MWGLAYIFTAIFTPAIAGDVTSGKILYALIGVLLLFTLLMDYMSYDKLGFTIIRFFYCLLGAIEVFGGIASWTGLVTWNVPFTQKEMFNISMAFVDLLSAVFLFVLAIDKTKS